MDPAAVTAVILTRDEERNLPRALTSLPSGMRVFVLDAFSSDRTAQFARASGADVVERAWSDFVDARTFALTKVRTPWVLMIDADEALDDVLREALVDCNDAVDAYRMHRTTYFCGRPLRQWKNESLLRLFRVGKAALHARPAAGGSARLHERWVCSGRIGTLAGTLLHFSYPDYASYRAKYERYVRLESEGRSSSIFAVPRALAEGTARLFWLLLVRGALLDGPAGVYVAWKSAFYPAAVALKAEVR